MTPEIIFLKDHVVDIHSEWGTRTVPALARFEYLGYTFAVTPHVWLASTEVKETGKITVTEVSTGYAAVRNDRKIRARTVRGAVRVSLDDMRLVGAKRVSDAIRASARRNKGQGIQLGGIRQAITEEGK